MGIHVYSDDLCPMTKVISIGPRYNAEEIEVALPRADAKVALVQYESAPLSPEHLPLVDDAATYIAASQPMLWAGKWDAIKGIGKKQVYPSQSEADMALSSRIARHLAERGAPIEMLCSLTEAVFNRSGLAERDKWQAREDYRANTIGRACAFAPPVAPSGSSATVRVDWTLHGDVRNARFFADKWKDKLVYVHERKRWMRWDSSRWAMCVAGEEIELAKETCQAIYKAAGEELAKDPEKAQKLVREAAQAHLAQRIKC